MKKSELRNIIKEELQSILKEQNMPKVGDTVVIGIGSFKNNHGKIKAVHGMKSISVVPNGFDRVVPLEIGNLRWNAKDKWWIEVK